MKSLKTAGIISAVAAGLFIIGGIFWFLTIDKHIFGYISLALGVVSGIASGLQLAEAKKKNSGQS